MNHPLPDMMSNSISKVKEMVDANVIIGDSIVTPEGVTIIPISKVKVGYAGGGTDFMPKDYPANKPNAFGGGSGAGLTVEPVAFLVIKGESVRMLPVAAPASSSLDRLIELIPELVDQVKAMLPKKDKEETEKE